MENKLERILLKYDALLNSQKFIEEDLDYSILEKQIPYLKKIDEMSNSAIMIFDLFKRQHVFISNNISRILNIDLEKAKGKTDYIDNRIHPEDYPQLIEAGLYFLHYGFSLPLEHRKQGKLINEYRILNEKGKYVRIIEQQMCLETDLHGNVWLAMGIMDISPDQNENAPFRSRLIDILKGEVYKFPPPNKEAMLTARETEILQLISKGLISKQIADKLFISVNTVNTHRQRILEKLQADNAIEAIKYASKLGFI
ncbi:MAG: LuxR family transcriptional regulator [Bacteroidetes bacterium]|nr:LuxR family transcriptional regulator [Bacteroidota bacterium]